MARRLISMAMVAVATILAFLTINALWLNRQFLNTDNRRRLARGAHGSGDRDAAPARSLPSQPAHRLWVLFAVLVLLIMWGPLPSTRNPLSMLVLAGLLALGVQTLRRQVEREFPAATMESARDRRRERVTRLRETETASGRQIHDRLAPSPEAAQGPDPDPTAPGDRRRARPEQLGKLRDDGVLDEDEFKREKELVLTGSSS